LNRCPDARALLPEYVEGELSSAETARVAGHLQLCGGCRAEEARFRQAMGLLSAPRSLPEHGDLYAGFAAKLDRHENRFRLRPRQLRWAGSLACLLLVVGVSASVVQMGWLRGPDKPRIDVGIAPPAPLPHPDVVKGEKNHLNGIVPKSMDKGDPSEVVTPEPDVPEITIPKDELTVPSPDPVIAREERPERRGSRGVEGSDGPPSFTAVRDKHGRTASDLFRERRTAAASAPKRTVRDIVDPVQPNAGVTADPAPYAVNMPSAPNVSVIVPSKEERVRVGDRVTRVRRETGYDADGELALIRIKAEPEKTGDKPGDKPADKSGPKTGEKTPAGPTTKDADKTDADSGL
jgi:hypothetical protein